LPSAFQRKEASFPLNSTKMSAQTTTRNAGNENVSQVKKRIYVGNLANTVTKEDIEQLFGLSTTPYLRQQCWVELSCDADTGKSKGFAFVTVPEHITEELLKLTGIEFYGRQIVIEEAKSTEDDLKDNKKSQGSYGGNRGGRNNQGRQNNNRDNRGRNNQNRGGNNQNYNRNRKGKFEVPTLEPDQLLNLIDCGVNLTNPKYGNNTDNVICRASAAGIQKMVITGLKFYGVKSAIVMSKTRPNFLYTAAGVHPHFLSSDWKTKTGDELDKMISENSNSIVAVGETGLDFNRDFTERDLQKKVFEKHVELACKHNKTLLVHDRDAHDSVLEILAKHSDELPKVVIHCFTGTQEHIKAYLEKGFYIGVTGFVCKEKHGKALRDAIKNGVLPLDRIVLQSNGPWMIPNTPQGEIDPVSAMLLEYCYNGLNEPVALPVVVRTIAKQLAKDPREVADALTKTALELFKFPHNDSIC